MTVARGFIIKKSNLGVSQLQKESQKGRREEREREKGRERERDGGKGLFSIPLPCSCRLCDRPCKSVAWLTLGAEGEKVLLFFFSFPSILPSLLSFFLSPPSCSSAHPTRSSLAPSSPVNLRPSGSSPAQPSIFFTHNLPSLIKYHHENGKGAANYIFNN